MTSPAGLRIALLTYRGNPRSGGQGVYVRYLSRALVELGHEVEVMSGQPYPELEPGVDFLPLPSLDLYRADDPFRVPKLKEYRDGIDVLEFASMCTAAFPEPLTFSLRAARALRGRRDIDVVHDNQSLGYGLLRIRQPLVATVHHPCSIDARIETAHAEGAKRRASLKRWYSFTKMQSRVAPRIKDLIAVSEAGREDVVRELGVKAGRVSIVHNGVDTDLFRPLGTERVPGRLITTASADVPLKGLVFLIEAVAKLRTERDVSLVVVGKTSARGPVRAAIERFDLQDAVRFETDVDWARLIELYSEAEVAVVPSLYEGFSLPAVEAMACEVPLVATTGGALPEVAGRDGETALLVPPRDAGALAAAIDRLLADEHLRRKLGSAARARVLERFTWRAAAERTVDVYRRAMSC